MIDGLSLNRLMPGVPVLLSFILPALMYSFFAVAWHGFISC
ncbi:putative membrane protein [Synechococcus sp. BIOS-E4-1]|nr:putative membrane protein [Synechococcus sp. BIOS-E4-1]